MDIQKFTAIVETAKAKAAGNAKWMRAIERAAAGLQSNDICVTLFCDGYALVTTPTGQHRVNGRCDCTAAKHGHKECVHRVAKRLTEMIEETTTTSCGSLSSIELKGALYVVAVSPAPEVLATKAATSARVPRIVRSVERDHSGARYTVTYYDNWAI
jgi:hypothetical protein